jgi:uncharacterized glyoxalase superfamily protein PhnB
MGSNCQRATPLFGDKRCVYVCILYELTRPKTKALPLRPQLLRRHEWENAVSAGQWQASPILGAPHVRQAAEYYRDVLGFDLDPVEGVFQPTDDEPGGVYAIVTRPGAMIHLQIRREPVARSSIRPSFERDVYLYVDALDELYTDLQRRGATIVQPPRVMPYGYRELVVEDLSGYRLAFGEECG